MSEWQIRTNIDNDGDLELRTYDIYSFPYGVEAGQQGVCYDIDGLQKARLIAAAPAMYEVIEPLLEAYCNMAQMINSECQFMGDQLTQQAHKALALAKGETE